MALMERVATLLRANLNDLIDRAQDPETLLKQFVLDLDNQLIQVKTQVAMALTDQHVLARKRDEQLATASEWHRRAELAISQEDDAIARAALERAVVGEQTLQAVQAQLEEQTLEVEALHGTYRKLEAKLAETRSHCELLIAQHRRARLRGQALAAGSFENGQPKASPKTRAVRRMQNRISDSEAREQVLHSVLAGSTADDCLAQIERSDRVEQLLADLKNKKRPLPTG